MSGRLDAVLADRGLARSRTHAARLIADGRVMVDGRAATKASLRIADEQAIEVDADHYVSRAAHKLIAALDAFGIDVASRVALDMGASTGGFTQVLRERGADPVLAVDVGHDQISPDIAADPGVRVVEGMNVRFMTPEALTDATGIHAAPSIVTGDLTFISLAHVIPAAVAVADPAADFLLLVKPQFEVGRERIRGGVVEDPVLQAGAVSGVIDRAREAGLVPFGLIDSPISGTHGNREFVVHLASGRQGDDDRIARAVAAIARGEGANPREGGPDPTE